MRIIRTLWPLFIFGHYSLFLLTLMKWRIYEMPAFRMRYLQPTTLRKSFVIKYAGMGYGGGGYSVINSPSDRIPPLPFDF